MPTKLEKILLAHIREANQNWNLFQEGEKVLVGISGGKDSLSLLTLLSRFPVELHAVHVQLNLEYPVTFLDYCRQYATVYRVETDIHKKVFAADAEKNPCFICMRLRRKAVVSFAMEHGFKKVFFGHHKNDVVETLILNQIYSREISTMLPRQPLFDGLFHICRPLYLIPSPLLKTYAVEQSLPVVPEMCPAAVNSRRNQIREWLMDIQKLNPRIDIVNNIFSSLKRINRPFIPLFPDTQDLTEIRKPKYKKS
ncbi:MAG: tRNA s2C32 biosynthesis protein [Marinimicrobia bacterium 46_47]|nr:MAG: tRNA s2C32 biosynthesis protein [Marinimicrobia bacterium 46_47]KUK92710.1 MAG: tRNA s2C32 biosynthesis protein [Marinimicrobia bacterium 46_43]